MTMRTHFSSLSSAIMRLSCTALLASLLGLATLLLFPAVALAHAEYVSSDPAANAALKNAPSTITIHFSEELDPKGSTILVYNVDHKVVSQEGSVQVSRTDLKTMTVALQPNTAASEVYVVDWQTVAADDQHHDAGSFRFFVNPDPALTTNNTSGQTKTNTPTNTTTPSSSGGLPVWLAVVIGIVALIVGVLAGIFGSKRLQKGKEAAISQ